MKPFIWTVTIEVDADLVADGIDLSDPEFIEHKLARAFPLARSSGFHVQVHERPSETDIRKAQGYDDK